MRTAFRSACGRGAPIALALVLLSGMGVGAQKPAVAKRPTGAPVAGARAPAALPPKLVTIEGLTEYDLPNGLRVVLFPDASKPTTTVNITYFVGSRNENYGETGMAHLFEHMLFKGSTRHRNIPQELTEHGAQPNGSTWLDRTNYFETFPATEAHLAWALDLEADRMVNSFIAKKDLESEMTVVRNEFEAGENQPFNVLMERTLSTAYLWHNYGKSTIGARSDIENVPIDRLQRFYRKYYEPDNALLVVAGKFDPQRTLALITQKFGAIPRPKRTGENALLDTYTSEPTQDGERQVTLRRVGDVQVVDAVFHVPAGSHPDFAPVDVLTEVLGSEPSGRLYQDLVVTKKAASTGAMSFQLREPGVLLAFAQVRKDDSLDSARVALQRTIAEAIAKPATSEEVERAKTALLKQFDLMLNNSDRVGLWLSEWQAMGDWRLLFLHRDRLRHVTPADVQRVAAAYLKPSNMTVGVFIPTEKPDRSEVPATPAITAMLAGYKGDTAVVAGEAFDPSPTNVDARTQRSTLANGFKLALLPKKTRGESVRAQVLLRFGSEQALMGRATAGQYAAEMLMRGTTKHTRQQIKDEFDRLKAQVRVFGGPTQALVMIETTRPNLPAVLRLVGEVLREPAFDAKEFEQLRSESLAQIEEQRSEPMFVAQVALMRTLSPYPKEHPGYVKTPDESVAAHKALTLDEVRKFYGDFYGAGAGAMAVAGDFDATEVATIARDIFGSWASTQPYVRIPNPYRALAGRDTSLQTPDKANAMFVAGENLEVRDDDPMYPGLSLASYMMGGGFLNSRFATRIRQKEGLSYGVASMINASSLDRSGIFMFYAIHAPQNVARLQAAFSDELTKALKDGFTADEVQKAKDGYLQSLQVNRAQDQSLVNQLTRQLTIDRTMAWDAAFEKKVGALTPDEIVAALRKFVDPSRMVVVKAGDFAKAAPTP